MKTKGRYFIFIILLTFIFGFTESDSSSKIENGIYVGIKKGILANIYGIMTVRDSLVYLEAYVPWQGQWMPINSHSINPYRPEELKYSRADKYYLSEYSKVSKSGNKIKAKLSKTFTGKTLIRFEKVDSLSSELHRIRNKSLLFTAQIKDSIVLDELYDQIDIDSEEFRLKIEKAVNK